LEQELIATDTGSLEEVEALGRVGAIAWNENQKTEVQIITGRDSADEIPAVD